MTEAQVIIEATKAAIIDLVLSNSPRLAAMVELVTEEDIQPYMTTETLSNDGD